MAEALQSTHDDGACTPDNRGYQKPAKRPRGRLKVMTKQ